MAGYLRMSQTIARPVDEVFATAGRLDAYWPYQTIATDDIGKLVALAFDRPGFRRVRARNRGQRADNPPGGQGFRACARAPCQVQAPADAHCPGRARQSSFKCSSGSTPAATKPTSRACVPAIPSCSSGCLRTCSREEGWEAKRKITVRRDKLGRPLTHT